MQLDRRSLLGASVGLAATATGSAAGAAGAPARGSKIKTSDNLRQIAGSDRDQTTVLQAAIDDAAARGEPLLLPAGVLRSGPLRLPAGIRIAGAGAKLTTLAFLGGEGGAFLSALGVGHVSLSDLTIDGGHRAWSGPGEGLLSLAECADVALSRLAVTRSARDGISLSGCGGRITDCDVSFAARSGVRSLDATGLTIAGNRIADCGDNGIQVWRSQTGEDGTMVSGNQIARIGARSGGTGENGNGVNVFRAGGVMVANNRIADCAYSAVRGNAASNIQIVNNNCQRIGEVALYAEFGFEGAVISGNVVDTAATGVSVTNFNEGGRLAVVSGNLIRNLFRREHERQDKRGEGIGVEADAAVSGNVIEGAPTAGIAIGWGRYMRDVAATGNVVRNARVGVLVSADPQAGSCLIANNTIAGAAEGAIRAMDHGRPVGPDLARASTSVGRVTITGNVAV